jgi:lactoylglutathione lyase
MKLNHINLAVTDVPATENFLNKDFDMHCLGEGNDEKFTVVTDDNGIILSLMKVGQGIKYPGIFHIGFIQESEERVNEIYRAMKEDGFDIMPPQRSHAWTFYVTAPGGFLVEVLA